MGRRPGRGAEGGAGECRGCRGGGEWWGWGVKRMDRFDCLKGCEDWTFSFFGPSPGISRERLGEGSADHAQCQRARVLCQVFFLWRVVELPCEVDGSFRFPEGLKGLDR